MNLRRKMVLKSEGISPQKIESFAKNIAKMMCKYDITLAEANEIIYELDCILKNTEKHSPNTLLKSIADFNQ